MSRPRYRLAVRSLRFAAAGCVARANGVVPGRASRGRRVSIPSQAGYVLIPVMFAIALVAAVALMMNHSTVSNLHLLSDDLEGARADYVAQAGLQHGLWQARRQGCGPFSDLSGRPLGSASYSTTLATDLGATAGYTLPVDQDTWISSKQPTIGNPGDSSLRVTLASGDEDRALYRFDLSALPANASVLSATAWFKLKQPHPGGPVEVRRLTAAWTEAGATWENAADALDGAVLATIAPQPAADVWLAVNLTPQVQAWVNGEANHGIALVSRTEGVQAEYHSREAAAAPYLQVVTGTPPSPDASLGVVATLADGSQRSLGRAVTLTQSPEGVWLAQPDAGQGTDTYLYEWQPSRNYGAAARIWAENRYANSIATGLLRFDLSGIPPGAEIAGAELALYQANSSLNGGPVSVRRVGSSWVEGTLAGGTGAPNWTQRLPLVAWGSAGGDFDAAPVAVTTVAAGLGWSRWDVSALVAGWVSGRVANQGMALVAETFGTAAHFASSDESDPTLRPKLTVTYRCPCGQACTVPQGSGKVLMIVDYVDFALTPGDALKRDRLASWGYDVTAVDDDLLGLVDYADYDVVYVSSSAGAGKIGADLDEQVVGVVSELGELNNALGVASAAAWPVGRTIDVTNAGHYITLPFAAGGVPIFAADMEGLNVSGALAPGLQALADFGGAGALAVLDRAATRLDGSSAPGRRVLLPFGRMTATAFDWHQVNANGWLILQRALHWAAGGGASPAGRLLFVVADVTPTAQEQLRIQRFESWGYTVSLIGDDDTQAGFDLALADNDVVYVSADTDSAVLGTKLTATTRGIVNEQVLLHTALGFGAGTQGKDRSQIQIIDNAHEITAGFALGPLTIVNSPQTLYYINNGTAAGAQVLAQTTTVGSFVEDSLITLEAGAELWGGGSAAGRRVQLPWGYGGFDAGALNAAGYTIMQRAILWAAEPSPSPAYKVLMVVGDAGNLSSDDAARKDMVESWGHTVTVVDDGDSQANFDAAVAAADVAYVTESVIATTLGTKLKATTIGVVNEDPGLHSVFGFSTNRFLATANLSLTTDAAHFITEPFGGATLPALFSSDQPLGAAAGTLPSGLDIIGTWASGTPSSLGGLLTLDTGALISGGGTAAGRRVQLPWGGTDGVSVTDITALTTDGKTILQRSLEWAAGSDAGSGGDGGSPGVCDGTYRDEFNTSSFTGSDGSLSWGGAWQETGESDGATAGDLAVASDLGDTRLMMRNRSMALERGIDLSGATSATLSLEYRRSRLDLTTDWIALEISTGAGGPWTRLEAFAGPDNDTVYQASSHDISAYISPNTRIRLIASGVLGRNDDVFFDNIEVSCTP